MTPKNKIKISFSNMKNKNIEVTLQNCKFNMRKINNINLMKNYNNKPEKNMIYSKKQSNFNKLQKIKIKGYMK